MLAPNKYFKSVKRPYPLLCVSLFMSGYRKKEFFDGLLKEPYAITDMLYLESQWYYALRDVEEGGALVFRSWRNASLFKSIRGIFDERAGALSRAATRSAYDFLDAYEAFMPVIPTVYFAEAPIEKALRDGLTASTSAEETESLMSSLNTPLEPNLHRQEQYDLVNAVDLPAHVEKYRWLHSRYGDEHEYTLAEAEAKQRETSKEEFLEEWDRQQTSTETAITRAKHLLASDADLVDLFQFIIFYRTHRTDIINRASFIAIPALKERASELGISYHDVLFSTPDEIRTVPATQTLLTERRGGFSVILESGAVSVLSGKASHDAVSSMEEKLETVSELKGTSACKGVVTGRTRVVDSTTYTRVQEGEVLVTSMTTPQMVPYMKKASAFVTDEGGVTCHAAILSREMKKPCVIGTKFATKVFKDGDLVEVDADKGIVRKVS